MRGVGVEKRIVGWGRIPEVKRRGRKGHKD